MEVTSAVHYACLEKNMSVFFQLVLIECLMSMETNIDKCLEGFSVLDF